MEAPPGGPGSPGGEDPRRALHTVPQPASRFPNTDAVAAYLTLAEATARRAPGVKNSPREGLQLLFSDILVDNVWMVTVKNGESSQDRVKAERYYTTGPPADKGAFVQFLSLVSFGGKQLNRTFRRESVASRDFSPQSKIAAVYRPILEDELKLARWETVMHDLVARILNDPDIDPILQVALLRRVLDLATEGSAVLRDVLGPLKTRLDKADVDVNVPWMNPETDLKTGRERAAHCIATVRDQFHLPPSKDIDGLRNQIERGVLRTYPTVGWMAKDRQGW